MQMTPHVLVVEDEDSLATLLQYNLQKEGYEVSLAGDGEEALLMVDERVPDLIVLDWMLPKVSGSVAGCVNAMRPGTFRS